MLRFRMLRALAISSCLAGGAALAQSLDYGRFEGLFDEPVTMSATGKPERISDTPVTMDVITQDDIKRSGARDIPTLLQRLPGIDVYQGSPGTSEVSMGGFIQVFGSRVMVLLNGRQIYLGSFGAVFWSSLPVELHEIRQIEVIRGPQSALYGFNAVDGVINIVTFDPAQDAPVTEATARLGNDARRDIAGSVTVPLASGIGLRITAAGDHAHDEGGLDMPLSSVPSTDPDRKTLSMTLSASLPDGSRAGLEASHSDISERSVVAGTTQFFSARIQTDALKADYAVDTAVGRIGATASYTLYEIPEAQNESLGDFRLHDYSADGQVYDLFKPGPNDSIRLALEGRYESMNVANFSSGTLSGALAAGSAMWEHQFLPGLSMVNAVRYDRFQLGRSSAVLPGDIYTDKDFDRSLQGTSVNSSLIWRAGEEDTLRASFARGLSLPSLLNLGQLALFMPEYGGNYFYGNPNLNPSAVYEERIGWDHRVTDLDALARISLYHEQTMQIIATPRLTFPTPPPPACGAANPYACSAVGYEPGTGIVVNGVQLQIDHKSRDGLAWGANYSWESLHPHTAEDASGTVPLLQGSLPVHKVNATLGYGWGEWAADMRLFYSTSTKGVGVIANPYPQSAIIDTKDVMILAPHVIWSPSEQLSIDLSANNLWPYQDNLVQRNTPTYFLAITARY
jgi:iron complex outermembrane receptor protein